ncbi:heme ABC exporter ATP-binding protein CcmA [Mesobaculum littorinae]|uniref:Heme ABC exporter ATP-binding protein CcmA n=1 Tax=Mesobaculum littorinae TaxID=2486419 RepID=A0A438AJ56_9RHOB|nr:heme ABC exporter ATP-binding protein CcmA [Mesobaculum littorinae]RVV98637.1 heme ABC exporter ATP-binding protein CcmA [Mesobaculum littorinae]
MELSCRDLAVARGGWPLLSGVTFRVAPGRALILRGPNGSGKTTLLRTLAGLQPALSGRADPEPGMIAYHGHADGLKSTLTATENLRFWAELFGTSPDVRSALAAFGLERLADRAAAHMSAGQRRRLGLARLMVTGRPVWALDEPTVSLDTASVTRFASVLARHLDAGGAALIATHIDLGVPGEVLDVTAFRSAPPARGQGGAPDGFGNAADAEAFL